MRTRWIFIAPIAIVGMVLVAALGGEIVRQLWNWLMPPLLGLREVTFWQALGLLVLCRILFGGFGRGGSRSYSQSRMAARWEVMTPEERERFRAGMRRRFGLGPIPGEYKGE